MESHIWLITILSMKIWAFAYLFTIFTFYSTSQNDNSYFWYSFLKRKNEFTFTFKIKTAIPLIYKHKRNTNSCSRSNQTLQYRLPCLQATDLFIKTDVDISSIVPKKVWKKSRLDFYSPVESTFRNQGQVLSPVECHLRELKQEQEPLFLIKGLTRKSPIIAFLPWLAECSVAFITSLYVVSVLSA